MKAYMITQNDIDVFWSEFERDKQSGMNTTGGQQNSYGAYSPQVPKDTPGTAFPLPCETKSKTSTRASILAEAMKSVTGQRQTDYGTVEDNFQNIANLWNAYFRKNSKGIPNIHPTDVAAMMALMKIARLIHSPGHRDSWVDLAGYAACGAECGLKGTK